MQADLIATEREEAYFVFAAQREGLPVEHGHDISQLALLNIELVTRVAGALPGTSPAMVVDVLMPRGR